MRKSVATILIMLLATAALLSLWGKRPAALAGPDAREPLADPSTIATPTPAADELTPLNTLPCLDQSSTLEDLVACIQDFAPRRFDQDERDGFEVPSAREKDQWRAVVTEMMRGECASIDLSRYRWGDDFAVTPFTDGEDGQTYCVLMENRYWVFTHTEGFTFTRVPHGWGTFIHNPDADRQLCLGAPHVLHEPGTATQTVSLFKDTQSRTFLINGAHRFASDVISDCQPDYSRADVAHNPDTMFHATVEALQIYYDQFPYEFYHLQFHGTSYFCCDECDVYLSHGSRLPPKPGDRILALQQRLLSDHPDWKVAVVGDECCDLYGATNIQGRLLHGVPADQVCRRFSSNYSGYFLHIEQCPEYRLADDWLLTLLDTEWLIYPANLSFLIHHCPLIPLGYECWRFLPPVIAPASCGPDARRSERCYN
jgi:hypothetical protein